MRIGLAPDLQINQFDGPTITEKDSGIVNGIVEKRGDIFYTTQRPSIDIYEDAGDQGADARGRAIYYWAENSSTYIVNNDTIYKGTQATSVDTISGGTRKCKFLVLGSTLILLDPENNEGWTIATNDTVTQITDTDFPPEQTPAVGLAFGGAVLDKYLFVLGENGVIYNCEVGNTASWDALDFKEAERDTDGGQYLGKHHDNIVVYGVRTIEFFYVDPTIVTGSPLSRREDVAYQIGCSSGESVWEEGDRAFFVGVNFSGALSVYVLEGFAIRKASKTSLDSFLTQAIVKENYLVNGSGFTAQGHTYYILTLFKETTDLDPYLTLVYDDTTGIWGEWTTSVNGQTYFPIMDWSIRTGVTPRYGEGIFFNGDLLTINDNMTPQDTLLGQSYIASGYVASGYVLATSSTGTAIPMSIRTGMGDGGISNKKRLPWVRHVADITSTSQNLTIKWAKENNDSFSDGVTIDTSKFQKVTRIGAFRRINFDLTYAGSEIIRIESLEGNPI